jgi:MFS family permease
MVAFSANFAPTAAYLADLFDTKVRYSGLSITYMFGGLVGTAATLVITSGLLAATGSRTPIAWYMVATCVVSAVTFLMVTARGSRAAEAPRGEQGALSRGPA